MKIKGEGSEGFLHNHISLPFFQAYFSQSARSTSDGEENSRLRRKRLSRYFLLSRIFPSQQTDHHLYHRPGSRICKVAVHRGWHVTSISRSGEPVWSSITSSPSPPPWSESVSWEKADILKPESYKPLLNDADAVVHSMGILLEADYKGVITGKESVWSGLSRAFSAAKGGSQNPLERKEGEALEPQERDGQLTYELMNRDSGMKSAGLNKFYSLLMEWTCSNHPRPGSVFPQSPLLCIYLCGSGSSHASEAVYHHQKRCRVHHSIFITEIEEHLHQTRFSL